MKYVLIFFCLGCTKIDPVEMSRYSLTNSQNSQGVALRSAFPSYVNLGPDTTLYWTNQIFFKQYSAYLDACAYSQTLGVDVYQIAGPTQTIISWSTYQYTTIPTAMGTINGRYGFVAHGWVRGYDSCSGQPRDVDVYDTAWVDILKKRKKVKP